MSALWSCVFSSSLIKMAEQRAVFRSSLKGLRVREERWLGANNRKEDVRFLVLCHHTWHAQGSLTEGDSRAEVGTKTDPFLP